MSVSSDFVSIFIDLTNKFESPTSFWKWSAYAAIAATLRFNCYLSWGTTKLYPNLYVLLLADSAAYRKDAGPELVEELLKELSHTKVITGRASWQGIVDELSQDTGNKKTGIPIKHGAGIIIALELTAMFVEDSSLIKMMTEAYAFVPEYDYILRGGKTKIKNRCITLLGGSNETLLRSFYTAEASYGGLLRRTCLIKPDKRRPANPLVETKDHLTQDDKNKMLDALKEIQKLKGEFKLASTAKKVYIDWYTDLYNNYDRLEDKSGFVPGMHSLIMKLSMILTAADSSLEITEKIIDKAIKEILALKENYSTYAIGTIRNPHINISTNILALMWQNNNNGKVRLKRRDILLKFWNEISSEELDKIIVTLEGAGLIKMIPQGVEPAWDLTETAKSIFLQDVKSKSQKVN